MEQQRILPRQGYAFLLCAMSAPTVTAAAALPWPWVLAVTLLTATLLLGQLYLPPAPYRWLAGLRFVFGAVLLWHLALGADAAFPNDNTQPFVPLVLLLLCAYAACKGKAASVRAVSVLLFLLVTLYAAVFFFAAKELEPSRLLLLPRDADLTPLGVVLLTPFLGVPLLERSKKQERFPLGFLLLFVLLPPLSAAVCAAVPGSGGSFYTMAGSLEVLSFAQRMEPLVSVAFTVGWFCAMLMAVLSCGDAAARLGWTEKSGSVASCCIASVGILLSLHILPGILLLSGAVFCVIFPLLTQCFVVTKKGKNFLKKHEKNC